MGQLQVPDLAAVLVPPRRRPQVHILDNTLINRLSPGLIKSVHVSMNLAAQQAGQPPGLPIHPGTRTRQPANCGSQEERTREKQRAEKLLEDAQIKLSSVISDI